MSNILDFRVWLVFIFFMLFPQVVFFLGNIKLKVNFGYVFASMLLFFHTLYCYFFFAMRGFCFKIFFEIQYASILILFTTNKVSPDKETNWSDLKELCRKKGALMIATEILLVLASINPNYFPMALFIPMLMAFFDRLQSLGCHSLRILLANEMTKYTLILVGCFVPCYLSHFEETLLMEFDYPTTALYIFIGFVLIPAMFLTQKYLSRRSLGVADLVLYRKELHGRSQDRPMLIQKGQGDIIRAGFWKLPDYHIPQRPDKFAFYHPRSFLGVLELELVKSANGRDTSFRTGILNFYSYRRRGNPLAGKSPQRCQDLGYRPSIRFKILKNQEADHVYYHGYIIPVEISEAPGTPRLVVLVIDSYSKPKILL